MHYYYQLRWSDWRAPMSFIPNARKYKIAVLKNGCCVGEHQASGVNVMVLKKAECNHYLISLDVSGSFSLARKLICDWDEWKDVPGHAHFPLLMTINSQSDNQLSLSGARMRWRRFTAMRLPCSDSKHSAKCIINFMNFTHFAVRLHAFGMHSICTVNARFTCNSDASRTESMQSDFTVN